MKMRLKVEGNSLFLYDNEGLFHCLYEGVKPSFHDLAHLITGLGFSEHEELLVLTWEKEMGINIFNDHDYYLTFIKAMEESMIDISREVISNIKEGKYSYTIVYDGERIYLEE